jgi:hypothetical protein
VELGPGVAQGVGSLAEWSLWGGDLACPLFFSRSWCGEAFHELGVQSAEVLALPVALPQPSVSLASWQSP